MAGGDKDAIEKARKKIVNALIGLAIVFSAYAILFVIRVLFNVNLIQFDLNALGSGGGGGAAAIPPAAPAPPAAGYCGCAGGTCAAAGAYALGDDNLCHTCQANGLWTMPGVAGACPPISCFACPAP
jgi:hypothetical protein